MSGNQTHQIINRMIAMLNYENSADKFRRTAKHLRTGLLELSYRPNQPRAPKGTAEGGQWVEDARATPTKQPRLRQALTEMGILRVQIPRADGTFLCVYDFESALYAIPTATNYGCGRITSRLGEKFRLNDN